MRLLPLHVGALASWLCVGCAHRADPAESSAPQDPLAHVRRENETLQRRVQMLEDRVLRLERQSSQGVAAFGPSDREIPVVRLEPQTAPEPVQARQPEASSKYVRRAKTLRAPKPAEPAPTPESWDSYDDAETEPLPPERPSPSASSSDAPASAETRSYRLVGSRLVELTKANAPTRPDRPGRGRKADDIVAEYERALELYRAGEHVDAEARFEAFARRYPKHDYADNALYWKGEAAYDQHHFGDALAAFTEVVERYGGGNKAPDALLKIGLCYQKLGDADNAKDVLSQLIAAYPAARASNIARARLAEIEI